MLKLIALVLVGIIALVLFMAARKPDTFRYERSAYIDAPPSAVFPLLNNTKAGEKWSPWVENEPEADYSYSGPEEGVGAVVSWEGKKSGVGSLTIVESVPNELVRLDMQFLKPMKGTATIDYILTPQGDGTRLTWAMYGPQTFMGKLMSIFMDCEKMVVDTTMKGFDNINALLKKDD
jgi:uncharacterized protein YndB with AHSA1/START domain